MQRSGIVYLVGAGPGDPDLLTLKANRLLQTADVVIYDRLVSEKILELIPTGVSRIPVGKESGHHSVQQDVINKLLAGLAKSGRTVVRLKGGDPFVFGRGSEEALHLRQQNIRFEIVPGVTAAVACAAYAGVPLTHRGISRGFHVVTGHLFDNRNIDLDWRSLVDPESTLVIYMGLANIEYLCTRLVREGLPQTTPAMAIQNGTLPEQKIVRASLNELSQHVKEAGLCAPVLILIGETVSLANDLSWFGALKKQAEVYEFAAHRI